MIAVMAWDNGANQLGLKIREAKRVVYSGYGRMENSFLEGGRKRWF